MEFPCDIFLSNCKSALKSILVQKDNKLHSKKGIFRKYILSNIFVAHDHAKYFCWVHFIFFELSAAFEIDLEPSSVTLSALASHCYACHHLCGHQCHHHHWVPHTTAHHHHHFTQFKLSFVHIFNIIWLKTSINV